MQDDTKIYRKAKMHKCQKIKNKQLGFTLIELMVGLMVFGIAMAIAIPSYKNLTVSSQLTVTNNALVASINTARIEALRRGRSAQFCSNSGAAGPWGTACNGQAGAVYASKINNATQNEEAELIQVGPEIPSKQHITNMVSLVFDAKGVAYGAGSGSPFAGTVAVVCTGEISSNNQRTITMAAGSILRSEKTTGGCP